MFRLQAEVSVITLSLIAIVHVAAFSDVASGQCFSWSTGFGAPPALGTNGDVRCMRVWDADGWGPNPPSLYVGGSFTSAGGVAVHGLARWDGTAWHDVGGGVTGDTASVYALAVHNGALYVGGDFTTAGAVPALNIARWNGASWSALGAGTAGNFGLVRAIASFPQDPSGATLYAGGDFTSAGGVTANFIARWNGSVWSALGATVGTSVGVFALLPYNDAGTPVLMVGGAFPTAGLSDPNTKFIARWDGTTWASLGPGLNSTVHALATYDADGPGPATTSLVAAGAFTTTSGGAVTLNRVGKWTGGAWSGFGAGVPAIARSLAVFDDECGRALYVSGDFIEAAGAPGNYVARWHGTVWKPAGVGTGGATRALAAFIRGNNNRAALYAGGSFTFAGGGPAFNFIPWLSADTDQDGLYDCWESPGQGIDINCDGIIDLNLNALGATPDHKDIFIEVDSMAGFTPDPGAIADVILSFSMSPVANPDTSTGVRLFIDEDEPSITPNVAWTIDDIDGDGIPDWPTEFDALKTSFFGTVAERSHPTNAANILAAKRLAFRYCIYARNFDVGGSSGIAEIGGNDFAVTLGLWNTVGGTPDQQAGTFMHELGHTLGLHHGGNQVDPGHDRRYNYKPNYRSVMNYTWQTPLNGTAIGWELDYSRSAYLTLDETGIVEAAGMGGSNTRLVAVSPYFDFATMVFVPARLVREGGAVRLNDDIDTADTFAYDINRLFPLTDASSPGDTLLGHNDWLALDYNFRDSADYADGAHQTPSVLEELDDATHDALDAITVLPSAVCLADIAPVGGNDVVNVEDLLAVIGAWGACGNPSNCPADIAPASGDDVVNVQDLLAVIGAWGACP